MVCPSCSSSDLKKLSLIYMTGTYDGKGVSRGVAAGGGHVGAYRGRYEGVHQSKLAKATAPPVRWPVLKPFIYAVVGMFGLIFVRLSGNAWNALFIVYWSIALLYLAAALFYNLARRPQKVRQWESSFMCQRCGAIVTPQAAAASQV
jgi:hypothetical protein